MGCMGVDPFFFCIVVIVECVLISDYWDQFKNAQKGNWFELCILWLVITS